MRKSIRINAFLNMIKVCVGILLPLITYPYLARVLGAENMGKLAYSGSIVSYFTLLASFGIAPYAIREISAIRNSHEKANKMTSELFTLGILMAIISYVIMTVTATAVPKFANYKILIMIQGIAVLFNAIGMDWLNTVYEDFLYITIRSVAINILSLILTFCLIRTQNDYIKSVFITLSMTAIVNLMNCVYLRKYQKPKFLLTRQTVTHFKHSAVFFCNAIAVQIYVYADTTMLGWMKGDYSVGLYSASTKVYTATSLVMTSIYNVSIPRLSDYWSNGKEEDYLLLVSKITSTISILLIPIVIGMVLFADGIIYAIAGKEYADAALSLKILAIAMFFSVTGGIITQCIHVTAKREKYTVIATTFTAVENILLNLFFIQQFAQNGASLTTLIAQFTVFSYCAYKSKDIIKKLNWKHIFKTICQVISASMIIIFCKIISVFLDMSPAKTLIMIPVCIAGYLTIMFAEKNVIVRETADRIFLKLRKKRGKVS